MQGTCFSYSWEHIQGKHAQQLEKAVTASEAVLLVCSEYIRKMLTFATWTTVTSKMLEALDKKLDARLTPALEELYRTEHMN